MANTGAQETNFSRGAYLYKVSFSTSVNTCNVMTEFLDICVFRDPKHLTDFKRAYTANMQNYRNKASPTHMAPANATG